MTLLGIIALRQGEPTPPGGLHKAIGMADQLLRRTARNWEATYYKGWP
jgi:hypothetical protein